MNCQVCNGKLKKINLYSFVCKDCKYYSSNLKPSVGQDVKGIESLRRKNFKQIIKQLLKYKIAPKILEIGSGDGYFIDECNIANLQITGSEASLESLKKFKLAYREKIIRVHLPKPIQTKRIFDIVIFNDVFEHLEKNDFQNVQNFVPLYLNYFNLDEKNYNSINLNQKYHIESIIKQNSNNSFKITCLDASNNKIKVESKKE